MDFLQSGQYSAVPNHHPEYTTNPMKITAIQKQMKTKFEIALDEHCDVSNYGCYSNQIPKTSALLDLTKITSGSTAPKIQDTPQISP